jgi:PII-like signaling protein
LGNENENRLGAVSTVWVGRSSRPVSGATVTRGIAGFGADHHLHTTSLVDMAVRLPVKIEFIETAEKVEELLPKLRAMAATGRIEMHDSAIAKPAERKQKRINPPSATKNSYASSDLAETSN